LQFTWNQCVKISHVHWNQWLEIEQNWDRIRFEMYTRINVFENHMKFKITSLKIEMSKEINVTKYEGCIEEI